MTIPIFSDYALDNQTEQLMEPIYEEYWSYKDKIVKEFEFDTFEESTHYIQSLRNEVKKTGQKRYVKICYRPIFKYSSKIYYTSMRIIKVKFQQTII